MLYNLTFSSFRRTTTSPEERQTMAALAFEEQIFATKHAVHRWQERVWGDGPATYQELFRSARRARPATLAELQRYRKPYFKDTRVAVDDEAGVVHFIKRAGGPPEGWDVATVLKITQPRGSFDERSQPAPRRGYSLRKTGQHLRVGPLRVRRL
jgi:hypothetical protein